MPNNTLVPWRRRMSGLSRGAGRPHTPLFMPLLHGVAAEIDALPIIDFVSDPTKLRKGLSELRHILDTSSIISAIPSAMEAEALGAEVNTDVWPPVVVSGPKDFVSNIDDPVTLLLENDRVQASVVATQQLADLESGEVVLTAVLTGPATLLAQLGMSTPDDDAYDFAGRAIAGLARQYAEAGIHVLVLHETVLPIDIDAWKNALGPIANVARFHRVSPLLVFDTKTPVTDQWPAQLIACPSVGQDSIFSGKAHGVTWTNNPDTWVKLPDGNDNTRVIITASEPAPDVRIEMLRAKITTLLSNSLPD